MMTNRTAYPVPALPTLGGAGTSYVDPIFGSTIQRVTDAFTLGGSLVTWTVTTTGPITMGLALAEGLLPSGQGVQVGADTTQTDVQATWGDGSAKHLVVSYVASALGAVLVRPITDPGGTYTPTWPTSTSVAFLIGSDTYTAALPAFDGSDTWLNGAIVREARVVVTPVHTATPHPTLEVIFDVRSYAAGGHRVDVQVQNIRNSSSMDKVTYDLTVVVAGSTVFTKSAYPHFTGQRWRKTFATSLTEGDAVEDFSAFQAAKLLPNFLSSIKDTVPDTSTSAWGIGGLATMTGDQAAGGYRPELNLYTELQAEYIAHPETPGLKLAVLLQGDASGVWPAHINKAGSDGVDILRLTDGGQSAYRFDAALAPGSNAGIDWPGSGAFDGLPSIANGAVANIFPNGEHLLNLSFIPYLVTGDRWHLDQLKYWAAWAAACYSNASPNIVEPDLLPTFERKRNGSAGVLWVTGITREMGHPLMTVVEAAIITPDSQTTDRTYFRTLVANNVAALADYVTNLALPGGIAEFLGWEGFGPGVVNADTSVRTATYSSYWRLGYTAVAMDLASRSGLWDFSTGGDEFIDRVSRGIIGFVTNGAVTGDAFKGAEKVPNYVAMGLLSAGGTVITFPASWPAVFALNETQPELEANAKVAGVSITRSGTTATVTVTGLNVPDGGRILVAGAVQTAYNGNSVSARVNANSVTYPVSGSPATPATGSLTVTPEGWSFFTGTSFIGFHGVEFFQVLSVAKRRGLTGAATQWTYLKDYSGADGTMISDLNDRCGYAFYFTP